MFGAAGDFRTLLGPVGLHAVAAISLAVLLNVISIARVRVWNPTREIQITDDEEPTPASTETNASGANVHRAPGRVRQVWDNRTRVGSRFLVALPLAAAYELTLFLGGVGALVRMRRPRWS